MTTKTKVSAKGTFIFNKEDLEEFDQLSLTCVLDEAARATDESGDSHRGTKETDKPAPVAVEQNNETINALLENLADYENPQSGETARDRRSDDRPAESALLDHRTLFSGSEFEADE